MAKWHRREQKGWQERRRRQRLNEQPTQMITLTTLNGKVVMQKELQGSRNEIDLSSLKAGVYFIRWSADDQQEVQKIVKY